MKKNCISITIIIVTLILTGCVYHDNSINTPEQTVFYCSNCNTAYDTLEGSLNCNNKNGCKSFIADCTVCKTNNIARTTNSYNDDCLYNLNEAVSSLMKKTSESDFIELHAYVLLENDKTIRNTVLFTNPLKKKVILVFCNDDKVEEALNAGATYAGSDEYIDKVKNGWLDFDLCISTPDLMNDVGKLSMVLGRKGLIPNPKTGTVTNDVADAIKNFIRSREEFKSDESGSIHLNIGNGKMTPEQVIENINDFITRLDELNITYEAISLNLPMQESLFIQF